jgi:presenilin-like A22 family membrane protease
MKHPAPLTIALIALFLASQVIGLFIVSRYVQVTPEGVVEPKELPYQIERPQMDPISAIVMIVLTILIGTGFLLLIMKFRKFGLWKVWYFLSIWITLAVALAAFMPQIYAAILALIAAILKAFKPNTIIHNLTELLIYGGLAAIFVPLLNVAAAAILLLIISAYDAYAVWQSRHMVKLAQFQANSGVFAGLALPYKKIAIPSHVKETKETKETKTELKSQSAIIGGGDMGFPLIFAGAVMLQVGLLKAMVIPATATVALGFLLLFSKKGKFYPAMPFLSVGCFAGYGLILLLP